MKKTAWGCKVSLSEKIPEKDTPIWHQGSEGF